VSCWAIVGVQFGRERFAMGNGPMKSSEAQQLIDRCAEQLVLLDGKLFVLMTTCRSIDAEMVHLVQWLHAFTCARRDAILLLLRDARPWDAEMLLRSILEATYRALFVCLAQPPLRAQRLEEYWEIVSASNDLKHSSRASLSLRHIQWSGTGRDIFSFLVLDEEEEKTIRVEYPREKRKAIDQQWSFAEISAWIDRHAGELGLQAGFSTLLHGYGNASHFIHADERAALLMLDRATRPPGELEILEDSHLARLLSDMLSYQQMFALGLVAGCKLDRKLLQPFAEADVVLNARLEELLHAFYKSQERFYADLRARSDK
jgi:hypothetical protein